MRVRVGCLLAACALAACGRRQESELRGAFAELREAFLERNYEKVWDCMDSGSREALSRQLSRLKELQEADPLFEPMWRATEKQFGLRREEVITYDTRRYFLALLHGLDRTQPELRARQLEDTRNREIVGITIKGQTAQVQTKTTSGATETFTWIREGTWKCKADVAE
jgi:hypothetical protein